MEEVVKGVFAETDFFGCNPGFIVTRDGVVMVDTPQKPTDWPGWKAEIEAHGPVRWLINTEHHWDHTMGNPYYEGIVAAHDATHEDFYKVSSMWGFGIDWAGQPRDSPGLNRSHTAETPTAAIMSRIGLTESRWRIKVPTFPLNVARKAKVTEV